MRGVCQMIALMLDVSDLRVLVIGNGTVGNRKAQYFSGEAREVRIVDTETKDIESLIPSYDIIIAATDDPAYNQRIADLAKRAGKWYNSATGQGNFLIPAVFREGDMAVAVSTNGKSPAAAAYIRDKIEHDCPALPKMIDLQDKLRTVLKQSSLPQERRATILRAVLDDDHIWAALEDGEIFEAEKLAWRYL
ncbi:MAG TPA: bifunctional precorrin-2 dehydrogenase/sirohydrochlorin ferrochelatase [Methanocorpusculum sp.]|nr:bifunctional precorrin-2 dehydrogenase/sirohydrochlorin ferrochelatase [Methanocorpusculum sp.]